MPDKPQSYSLLMGFNDTNKKVEASLLPAIAEHVHSTEFNAARDGLDFLEVKNSLLLSYLIDLTHHVRQELNGNNNNNKDEPGNNNGNLQRLTEMKTALDKIRPLEKKMRYQLDKLLTATMASSSTSFAVGGSTTADPLQYRPDPKSLKPSGTSDSSDEERGGSNEEDEEDKDRSDDEMDDDLVAAKATLVRARLKGDDDDDINEGSVYRAPRLASMPYPQDDNSGAAERQKRLDRRLNTSELVQTLRSQYGEAPEQEDVHGGTEYGKQREAARRLAGREADKTRYEEEAMVRLVTSRKDKKEKQRLLREESSNLAAISDLGNLVRGVSAAFHDNDAGRDAMIDSTERYDNGKRKRTAVDEVNGRTKKGRKAGVAKNSLQKALYGKEGKSKKKKR